MHRLPLTIALRYLLAKKSQNIINIISMISALGVMVGTAALLIVLSVFNGLNGFVGSLFGAFDPDLKIELSDGGVFQADSILMSQIAETEGVVSASAMLVDNVLIKAGKRQMPATLMGVDSNYCRATDFDSIVIEQNVYRQRGCALGYILADQLGVRATAFAPNVTLYAPKRVGQINMAMPETSFITRTADVGAIFMVKQVEYDANIIVANVDLARELFCHSTTEVNAVALRLTDEADVESVKTHLKNLLEVDGQSYVVRDKWQQHESFFRMLKIEKFMAFLILIFIITIAAFNIIGSLSMLIYEKKESIAILKSLGASRRLTTRVFLYEGFLVSVGGVIVGLILGVVLVLLQQHFGLISFGDAESYIISAYPVELQIADVASVFVVVVSVGILAAWWPVHSIVGRYYAATN